MFTVLFTNLLNRRQSTQSLATVVQWIGLLAGTLAIAILVTRGEVARFDVRDPLGIAWGLGAGASYGLFSALSSRVDSSRQLVFLFYSATASVLVLLPLAFAERAILADFSLTTLTVVLASGVLLDGFGYYTWTLANSRAREQQLDIAKVASITLTLPFLSAIIVSLIYQESDFIQPYFALAVGLLTVSSLLCQRGEKIAASFQRRSFPQTNSSL